MAIHSVELWLKGFAERGFHLFRARKCSWALFDTGCSEICAGFASEPLDAPVN